MTNLPEEPNEAELQRVAEQLGRTPRGVVTISYYTPDGEPGVVMTAPRLSDGTPFLSLIHI